MSELVVIVLRDFVTDFTSVGGIIPTNLCYFIPILPWLAIVEVIAQIIFPIIPLGGFADCTSISVVKVTRVSSWIISLPWHARCKIYACKSSRVIPLSRVTEITCVVWIIDTITRCGPILPWQAWVVSLYAFAPLPFIEVGGIDIADFTSVSGVLYTNPRYFSLPWIARWIFFACSRGPVIVSVVVVTSHTCVVGIVETFSIWKFNLVVLANANPIADVIWPVIGLGVIASYTCVGGQFITHIIIQVFPWITAWSCDAGICDKVKVLVIFTASTRGGIFLTLTIC
jgi:hypothetical protein